MQRILLGLIRAYQLILSPIVGYHCRFTPSCSRYATEAIQLHGSARGTWLAIRRIARCHPFCEGGLDPVPRPAGEAPPAAAPSEDRPPDG
ncbi:MAG: membrane protein insertion efficiency factor YidD [Xanthomonadales bacterium]|nr:membrane protein insertion efficiency factor YidD [Xanthomonadales bacterium]